MRNLYFIKTRNTQATGPGGKVVEVLAVSEDSGYQTFVLGAPSDTPATVAANGVWNLAPPMINGFPTLYFIQTRNTKSGHVELQTSVYQPATDSYALQNTFVTWYSVKDADSGVWRMCGPDDQTTPDLYFIKTSDCESNTVEVHAASGVSSYAQMALQCITNMPSEVSNQFRYVVSGPFVGGAATVNFWDIVSVDPAQNVPYRWSGAYPFVRVAGSPLAQLPLPGSEGYIYDGFAQPGVEWADHFAIGSNGSAVTLTARILNGVNYDQNPEVATAFAAVDFTNGTWVVAP